MGSDGVWIEIIPVLRVNDVLICIAEWTRKVQYIYIAGKETGTDNKGYDIFISPA